MVSLDSSEESIPEAAQRTADVSREDGPTGSARRRANRPAVAIGAGEVTSSHECYRNPLDRPRC